MECNKALKINAPKYNKKKFEITVEYALTLTTSHKDFYPLMKEGQEDAADKYAEDKLIPPEEYELFLQRDQFDEVSIISFAEKINRDSGSVLGRLQNDKKIAFSDVALSKILRHKYKVVAS